MNNRFILNASKFTHYINENDGWQKLLELQITELPVIKKMLFTTEDDVILSSDVNKAGKMHFKKQLLQQQLDMNLLNSEIDSQQKRLYNDLENERENAYDINTFCSEDILRERIRAIEKNYIELKSDLMKYISTIL